jgi:hypothetical protein
LNTIGREPKIPYADLEPKLRQLREGERLSLKDIGRRLGYSVDHLRKLCVQWRILIRVKTTNEALTTPLKKEEAGNG